jgi:hypothetical protein
MWIKRKNYIGSILFTGLVTISVSGPAYSQNLLGTSVGIANSSPAISWPRGLSFDSLGPNNLYPNGPEFGLSNTSGGFGLISSGPVSGVGLTRKSLSEFVQQEIVQPYNFHKRLTDIFNSEAASSSSILELALGSRFRTGLQRGSLADKFEDSSIGHLIAPVSLPNVDSILKDKPASPDSLLQTNLY